MSATRELVRDRIEEIEAQITESKKKGETVEHLESEKRQLMQQLTELNRHSGSILTDSPSASKTVLKG